MLADKIIERFFDSRNASEVTSFQKNSFLKKEELQQPLISVSLRVSYEKKE